MDWQSYLKRLSDHLLANLHDEALEELLDHQNITDYLGRLGCDRESVEDAENRIGFKLPESLRSFYLVSDGFTNADGFPVGIANILSVAAIYPLSECRMRELDTYADYVSQTIDSAYLSNPCNLLQNCVVIIDFDGNELGFVVRTNKMDDWPVVTYNPDGGNFELHSGFIDLMKGGVKY